MKKNSTIYFIIAAAAAYYAYLYFKNKNKTVAPGEQLPVLSSSNIVDSADLNIVETLRPLVAKNTEIMQKNAKNMQNIKKCKKCKKMQKNEKQNAE
jgi:hypothetical protein